MIWGVHPKLCPSPTPPGVRLHDLRHTMVSTLTEAGFDPRVIADRAGHTQITTTLGVYAHARPARDQDLAAHLAAQLDAG